VTERLSDADLERLHICFAGARREPESLIPALVEAYRALRAQQAPTTDEPAAWEAAAAKAAAAAEGGWTLEHAEVNWADGGDIEQDRWLRMARAALTAVPLYRHPAPATDDPTARVLAVLNDWETEEPEDGWGTLADDIRAALTQPG